MDIFKKPGDPGRLVRALADDLRGAGSAAAPRLARRLAELAPAPAAGGGREGSPPPSDEAARARALAACRAALRRAPAAPGGCDERGAGPRT